MSVILSELRYLTLGGHLTDLHCVAPAVDTRHCLWLKKGGFLIGSFVARRFRLKGHWLRVKFEWCSVERIALIELPLEWIHSHSFYRETFTHDTTCTRKREKGMAKMSTGGWGGASIRRSGMSNVDHFEQDVSEKQQFWNKRTHQAGARSRQELVERQLVGLFACRRFCLSWTRIGSGF